MVPFDSFGSAFVYCTLRRQRAAINDKANGSTFMEVNKTNFKSVSCVRPNDRALVTFREVAEPAFAQISLLGDERRTLTAIRYALLPKLVSGQIRVPLSDDPEEAVGAATEALAVEAS